jgi:DNA-binding NtrC family response regulator
MTLASIFRNLTSRRRITSGSVPVLDQFELIAISSDTRFFASLVHTATPNGWTVRWARSITGAVEMLAERSAPIVVYDCGSVAGDWSTSIARLRLVSEDPCIIMAAGMVSEELWREAISCRVYDVVHRFGHNSQLSATLRFAWKWRADRRCQERRVPSVQTKVLQHDYCNFVPALHGNAR